MTWVRLDEQFRHHPKMVEAGPLGIALHVCALSYCNEYLTDGFLPRGAVRTLVDMDEFGDPRNVAKDLVRIGIWEETEGGFRIHDFHDYQPTRDKVLKGREQAAERMRKLRQGSKSSSGKSSSEPTQNLNDSVPVPVSGSEPEPQEPLPQAAPKTASAKGPRDEIWDALVLATGVNASQITKSYRGAINSAVKQLKDVGATPDLIRVRAEIYKLKFPHATLTPVALAKHWAGLNGKPPSDNPEAQLYSMAERRQE